MKKEIRIGIFVGIALLILGTFIFIVGDLALLFRKPGYPLYVNFDSTAGLEKTAAVRMSGVKIGYVKDISLAGRRARVLARIFPKFRIPEGSKATLASLGLLGEKHLEILPGEKDIYLEPGSTIEGLPAVSFDQLGTLLLAAGTEIKEVGESLKQLMGEESTASLKDTIQNLSAFSGDLKDVIGSNKGAMNRGIQSASQAAQTFGQKITEVSQDLGKTIELIRNIAEENRGNIKIDLEKIKDVVTKMGESLDLLKETLGKINNGEGTVGKLVTQPDLYHEATGAVKQASKIVRLLSSMKVDLGFSPIYYGKYQELKSTLTLGIWVTPTKYFLTQAIRNPWESSYMYTLQGGVRVANFVPRAGILESEFGVGVDYLALKDHLVLSLEAWNRQPHPQFRLSSKFFPRRYFYLVFGVDDFTLVKKRGVFIGFGLGLR